MADPATSEPHPVPVTTVQDHLARVLGGVQPLPDRPTPLMEALGLPLAEDVVATAPLPGFDQAAMDGYAVLAADVATATPERPVHLPVVGEVGAGRGGLVALAPGTAARIMTGAPVPRGATAVVPHERTDRGLAQVQVREAVEPGQHVRRAGEDVEAGDLLVAAGTVLGPRHLALLAAAGRATVRARHRPRVVVLSTGSELREPGSDLGPDSLFDANSYLLAAEARRAGAIAYRVGAVPDEPRAFLAALEDQLVRADLVVTSGGVGTGDWDVVKEALAPLGVWFGPVGLHPGKPQGFGHVGDDGVPLVALPGNPGAAHASFESFVLPAIRRMLGHEPWLRPVARAVLTHPVRSRRGVRGLERASYSVDGGVPRVSPSTARGSHLVADLAACDAYVVVPEDVEHLAAGERVDVLLLDRDF